MADLYTKSGKPLIVRGDDVFDSSGRHVGRRRGDRIYAPDGRYAATIVGDRAIYRSTESGSVSSPFAPHIGVVGTAEASRVGTADWGDEPFN